MRTLFVVVLLASAVGCSTLTQRGAISPADVTAACHDASVTCAALTASGRADANVQQTCAAVAVACAGYVTAE